MSRPRSGSRRATLMFVLLALFSSACGPKTDVHLGLKNYDTDIVFGAKKKPPQAATLPQASLAPSFPGFIEPPPLPTLRPTATSLPPVKVACPDAPVDQFPPPAATDISDFPKQGLYPYRTTTRFSDGTKLSTTQNRVISNARKNGQTETLLWDIASPISGIPTGTQTVTYALQRLGGGSNTDGLFITGVVSRYDNGAVEQFNPPSPGLQIFAQPASVGVQWASSATDPIHSTSMALQGVINAPRRIDACGTVVEGWDSVVDIHIGGVNSRGEVVNREIKATYLIAPQLGGLIVADTVNYVTDNEVIDAIVNTLTPLPPPPL